MPDEDSPLEPLEDSLLELDDSPLEEREDSPLEEREDSVLAEREDSVLADPEPDPLLLPVPSLEPPLELELELELDELEGARSGAFRPLALVCEPPPECLLVLASLARARVAAALLPGKAWAAMSASRPASTTLAASSQPLRRRRVRSAASRASLVCGVPIAVVRVCEQWLSRA